MLETAYVITWRYSDGSGSGASAACIDKARAEKLLDLLSSTESARVFKIEAVPFDAATTEPKP